jgi:hypothetical protein
MRRAGYVAVDSKAEIETGLKIAAENLKGRDQVANLLSFKNYRVNRLPSFGFMKFTN